MKTLDRALQRWRVEKLRPYLRAGARVLDIGCLDGALFRAFPELGPSVGLDPAVTVERRIGAAVLRRGLFPDALDPNDRFDAVVALAVLEHVPPERLAPFAAAIRRHLHPRGQALLTVPEPAVDRVLDVLLALRLADGMSLEEHHGFETRSTEPLFQRAGFRLVEHERFQLGLNNLFVFRAPP